MGVLRVCVSVCVCGGVWVPVVDGCVGVFYETSEEKIIVLVFFY